MEDSSPAIATMSVWSAASLSSSVTSQLLQQGCVCAQPKQTQHRLMHISHLLNSNMLSSCDTKKLDVTTSVFVYSVCFKDQLQANLIADNYFILLCQFILCAVYILTYFFHHYSSIKREKCIYKAVKYVPDDPYILLYIFRNRSDAATNILLETDSQKNWETEANKYLWGAALGVVNGLKKLIHHCFANIFLITIKWSSDKKVLERRPINRQPTADY